MLNTPFSPWPSFSQEEADAVSRVLLSNKVNYWTGQECREFEKEFSSWVGTNYAVSLSNGTLALDIALKALNIAEGDDVIVTPRTFLASVSCVVTAGANPIFADVELDNQNLSARTIEAALTPKTKAVIVVHLAGCPAEMDEIMALSRKHNFYVIEDCAQAHGAKYKGKSVGSIGHIGAWSFCQDKIMTTGGEGGMVTTNSKDLWSKMWSYKDHGKSYEAVYEKQHSAGFRWIHDSFGTNWRMTELQACLGRIQLKKMSDWTKMRREHGKQIDASVEGLAVVRTPRFPSYIEHAEYKHYLFINSSALKKDWSRDRIIEKINSYGVPCYHGSCPEVYLEKAFEGTSWIPKKRLENAKALGETSIMLLVHPTLTSEEMQKTCNILRDVLLEAQD